MTAARLVNPPPTSEATTRSMRGNRAKDTKPEVQLRRLLRAAGYGGYRLHWRVAGRPDIAYPSRHIAIFVNGCFWHRCPNCQPPLPKSNAEFWAEKFRRNTERDKLKEEQLVEQGWRVFVVWECQLKEDAETVARALAEVLRQSNQA
jgi:DNA mismatch endonuclease, patch repair protein